MRFFEILVLLIVLSVPLAAQWNANKVATPPSHSLEFKEIDGPCGEVVLSIVCTSDGTLLAGTEEHGVMRSTNGGDFWQRTSLGSGPVWPLYVLPDGSVVAFQPEEGLKYPGRTVFMSNDGGESWSSPPDSVERHLGRAVLKVHGNTVFSTRDGYLHRSMDSGKTWTMLPTRPTERWPGDFYLEVLSDSILFALSASELSMSIDGGLHWRNVDMTHVFPYRIAREPGGGLLVAAYDTTRYPNPFEVFRLSPDGQEGEVVGAAPGFADLEHTTVLASGTMLAEKNGRTKGIIRSTDSGCTWQPTNVFAEPINDFCPSLDGTVYAATYGSIYRSRDDGQTWDICTEGLAQREITALFQDSTGAIFAGTGSGGLYRSSDEGASWEHRGADGFKIQKGFSATPGHIFLSVNVDFPLQTYTITNAFHSGDGFGTPYFLISSDTGRTWSIAEQEPMDYPSRFCRGEGLKVYANGRLWNVSEDGGLTWRYDSVFSRALDMAYGEEGLFVLREQLLWKRSGNEAWEAISVPPGTKRVASKWYDLLAYNQTQGAMLRYDRIYGTWESYQLSEHIWNIPEIIIIDYSNVVVLPGEYWFDLGLDAGQSWCRIVPHHDSWSRIFCVLNEGYTDLLLGTNRGMLRGAGPLSGIFVTRHFSLGVPYPNPSADEVTIPYTLQESGFVRITATTIDGREQYIIFEGHRVAGEYFARLDNYSHDHLLQGLYFINLSVNGHVQSQPIIIR